MYVFHAYGITKTKYHLVCLTKERYRFVHVNWALVGSSGREIPSTQSTIYESIARIIQMAQMYNTV